MQCTRCFRVARWRYHSSKDLCSALLQLLIVTVAIIIADVIIVVGVVVVVVIVLIIVIIGVDCRLHSE